MAKVTPFSGKVVPECCLYTLANLAPPYYAADQNFECGSKVSM